MERTLHAQPSSSSLATSTHQYLSAKRCQSAQSSLSTSAADLRELTNTLQELNNHFKKNAKILSEIKDNIVKANEKPDTRPADDTSGVHKLERVTVELRLVFLKIGEIDTLKEQFQAEAFIQARWYEPTLKGTDIDCFDASKFWNPLLYIDNSVGDLKNDVWHKVVYDGIDTPMIYEMRKIKGVFLENLELNDFPVDVQDLTITVSTTRTVNEVLLTADTHQLSAINTHAFIDQQEWRLHEHVETSTKLLSSPFTPSQNQHPAFSATCHAARRPGYFYWNVYFLIFFITVMAFTTFSVTYNLPQNRLQLSFTLLLTAVTFKWVVVRCLPTISYLTTLDKYVLLSMVMLCVVCAWHSIIAVCPTDVAPHWDNLAFITLVVIYTLFHLVFFLWMYFVTYRRRRVMKRKDKEYLKARLERLNSVGHGGSESDEYAGSAATTVVRKTLPPRKSLQRLSSASDKESRSNSVEQNHKILTNKHALEQQQHRASMRQSIANPNSNPFQTNYTGQQVLLTSGDIEAMTMKQFRIGTLGC
ncbi:unnamed protein product [Adineta steineri]|uniref:Neurotransmitter-gated ion-channel ligand-binding domain-containing protein n=1 Tax=Adineta steineri TaxID=433720 RepID=A0A819AC27_9BILA|nr:unnamed protein product [Adineta steineri]CAF3782136.1 unnamed protein product [Adineta steineri]CAF3856633.1 unnamed protein product [Adineta steineri]